ncbi:serpin A3-3 [Chanos chanos]|uniref:Thyroxine-binding globulin n=1 Tax=Chanos chanos TaxID=29144 RepID=A0A6J2WT48_CHACN|nr:serpin A3-3-like [Chanos chanos]XP_030647432.1 serpin A3-3-like [Chanos chanos]XP_030647433.1 serpin A3-3-like [Chanos chanos]
MLWYTTLGIMFANILWISALAPLLSVVHADHKDLSDHDQHNHLNNGSQNVYQTNNDFAFRLYNQIAANPDFQSKNLFLSPLSISMALAAVSLGARGKTHCQIFRGLGFNESDVTDKQVHQTFLNLLKNLNERKRVELKSGSVMFINESFKIHPEFLEDVKRFYLSDGFTTDFTKPAEAADMINNYMKEKTHGKIKEMVGKDISPMTVLVLLNYIYFKGKWASQFDPEDTNERDFHVNAKTTVPVQMMSKEGFFEVLYDPTFSATVLNLHYNDSISMMLVLPHKRLKVLEKRIGPDHLAEWRTKMRKRPCMIYIPKLSIRTSFSLNNILDKLGMSDMFTDIANFTGISDDPLEVSEVKHKATLDVDEVGAVAAGLTEVVFMQRTVRPMDVLEFNRPFMIFIIHNDANIILFMGKILNPLEN